MSRMHGRAEGTEADAPCRPKRRLAPTALRERRGRAAGVRLLRLLGHASRTRAGWFTARSARLLRSSPTPAALRPLMSWP